MDLHLSKQSVGTAFVKAGVGWMLAHGLSWGRLMTALGINPEKMLPARGLVAVPFLLYTMNILFWLLNGEERKGKIRWAGDG